MKTERELFEEWAKEQDLNLTTVDFSGCVNLIDKNGNQREWCYEEFDTDIAWKSWQARVPDGYKLVPVDPTEEMIKAMKNGNDEGKHATWRYRCRLQYKAMMGAAP